MKLKLKFKKFSFNPFQENTFILFDESNECIIIDPGCYTKKEQEILKTYIDDNKLKPVKLINTHCHIDHILGNLFVNTNWGVSVYMHKLDVPLLDKSLEIAKEYGLTEYQDASHINKIFINENDTISFGNTSLKVFYTPGHSPGHICLYNKESQLLISGDVIFFESIGRTDLPGGNYTTLINSIKDNILNLPENTTILCGHGPSTNLSYEKENNPFLK